MLTKKKRKNVHQTFKKKKKKKLPAAGNDTPAPSQAKGENAKKTII